MCSNFPVENNEEEPVAQVAEVEFSVGEEFESIDPREEGTLFRVLEYKPMGDKARAAWGVDDTMSVHAMELERHNQFMVGTRFRAMPVSLMVKPGTRRSNRSTGATVSARPVRDPKQCECGCGEMTKGGRFRPGHDARMHKKESK